MAWRKKICILGTMLLCTSMLYASTQGVQEVNPSPRSFDQPTAMSGHAELVGPMERTATSVVKSRGKEVASPEALEQLRILRIKQAENAQSLRGQQISASTPATMVAGKGGCPEDTITIDILTDGYASETSWTLTDQDSGTVVASGTGLTDDTSYSEDVCVAAGTCLDFVILDSYGDGIFSPGGYTLSLNGTAIFDTMGGAFEGSTATHAIGSGCVYPQGACCEGLNCTGTGAEHECAGVWFSGEDCATFECPENPTACPDDTLFGQVPHAGDSSNLTGYPSDTGFTSSGTPSPRIFAENYVVSENICEMSWWGVRNVEGWAQCGFQAPLEEPMTFEIKFYQDSGYLPGTEVASYTVSPAAQWAGEGWWGTDTLFRWDVDLAAAGGCVSQHNGWVSIQGVSDPQTCWFLWVSSPDGDARCAFIDDSTGGAWAEELKDLSICLQPAGLPGACCDDDVPSCTDDVLASDCPAGNRFAPGVLCADLNPQCGDVTGACCYADGTCSALGETECVAGGGSYRGDFTTCDPNPCVGACCEDDGSCYVDSESQCVAAGGTYSGDMTTCDPNPCVQACCFEDGTCQELSTSMCTAAGGTAQAEGTTCSPNECPQPIPTCPEENLIYGQPVMGPDDDWTAGVSDNAHPYKRYEYFPSGAMFTEVHFWGIEFDGNAGGCTAAPGTFEIAFYNDAGYAPGAEICSQVVTPTRISTGLLYHETYQVPLYEYQAVLTTPCVVPNAGWISIQHVDNIGACKFWAMSGTGGDGSSCGDNGSGMVCGGDNDYDISLCLIGEEGTFYGACCDDNTGNCTDDVLSTACYSPQRWVYNTLCADLDPQCGHLTGACCDPMTGDCEVTEEGACGGNYMGDWTTCDPNPCAQPGDDCTNPLQFSLPGICGDMDSDGDCDNDDYWQFVDCFGWCEGQPKYSEAGDADGDGCITFADYQAWIACYREFGMKDVGDVMYVDSNGYTCGRGDAYADTCLGYYDGGEDVIYEVTVTAAMDVEIAIDPGATTYTGIALTDTCPPSDTCLATSVAGNSSDPHSLGCKHLEPGTYYIMIDTWPDPACIDAYTLTVTECVPPTGRCCYGADPVECADVVEADCVIMGGDWAEGLTCADNPCPAPVAETCDEAVVVDAIPFAYGFDNDEATPDGPAGTCDEYGATGNMQNDVWFVWTAAEDCLAMVSVESGYDSIIVVRDGCDTLVELACADEGGIGDTEQALFTAVTGTTYYIQVGDNGSLEGGGETTMTIECTSGEGACCYPDGTCAEGAFDECTGTFQGIGTLCSEVTCPIVAPNDTCQLATEITTTPFYEEVDNSTANANAPSCNTSYTTTQNDVWYSYTTPAGGCLMHVEVFEIDSYDTVMGVYSGPDCDNLTEVDCLDDPDGYTVEFSAAGETTYWFQVGDYGSTAGGGLTSFELWCGAAPEGACCVDGTCTATTTEADCAGDWFEGETCPEFTGCPQPCAEDTVTITILTDSYSSETSWTLTDQATATVVASNGLLEDSTEYEIEFCADYGSCFDFVIVDSYGDGIFSPGGYIVALNGTEYANTMGGGFGGSTETVTVGSGCVFPTGACCEGTECTGTVTEAECAGNWFEGEDCATFECPEDPTFCPPDSMFSQLVHAGDSEDLVGYPSDTGFTSAGVGNERRFAENYSVDADICRMSWWGVRNVEGWAQCGFQAPLEEPMTFEVKFYQDSGYLPGTEVASYTVSPAAQWAGEGWWGTDTLFRWDVDLGAAGGCVSLHNGWVSIQGVSDPQTCWFLWVSSPDGDVRCAGQDADGGFVWAEVANDLSLCLSPAAGLTGSCCDDSDGTCADDVLAADCEGRWTVGVACADLDPQCGQIEGACCFPDGTCSVGTAADCTTNGGIYEGDGTDCSPNPCPQPGPDNDTCAEATVVDCGDTITGETTLNAVNDYTLTNAGCTGYAANGPDVVYSLTLAAAQRVTVTGTPGAWDLALYVITDCADAEGTCVAGNDSGLGGIAEVVAFDADAGVTYYIIVDGYSASATGDFDIAVACEAIPTGGACCHPDGACTDEADEAACTTAGGVYEGEGTACASTDCPQPCLADITVDLGTELPYVNSNSTCGAGDDHDATCMGNYDNGEDLVYELIVPADICVNVSLTSNTTYTGIAIGDTCPVESCTWMDTGSGTDQALTGVTLTAGTYYLMVDTWSSPDCIGSYLLSIEQCPSGGACCHPDGSCTDEADEAACTTAGGAYEGEGTSCASTDCPLPPPVNDACADAIDITSLPFEDLDVAFPYATDDANVDPSCDSSYYCGTGPANNGVWYTYTPSVDCDGTAIVSGADTVTTIWTGADCDNLTELGCSDPQTAEVTLTAGVQYFIMVSNYGCSSEPTSDLDISFDCVEIPTGGACCDPYGGCTDVADEASCADTYQGNGTACASVNCPVTMCPNDTITVSLDTDGYGDETTWEVREAGTNGLLLCDGGIYADNTHYDELCCVDAGGCFDFIIYDSYGDGGAAWEILLNDVSQGSGTFDTGYYEELLGFGDCTKAEPARTLPGLHQLEVIQPGQSISVQGGLSH